MTFTEAAEKARAAFREAGYPAATIQVLLPAADVYAVQREEPVARAIVEQALRAPAPRPGARLLAVVSDVRVYVEEPTP